MEYKTQAHRTARGLRCAACGHTLANAKYEGEFLYPFTIVYLRCRCQQLNEATINIDDPFYTVATDIDRLPIQATKIDAAPQFA
jgi:phage FluMu protein Com